MYGARFCSAQASFATDNGAKRDGDRHLRRTTSIFTQGGYTNWCARKREERDYWCPVKNFAAEIEKAWSPVNRSPTLTRSPKATSWTGKKQNRKRTSEKLHNRWRNLKLARIWKHSYEAGQLLDAGKLPKTSNQKARRKKASLRANVSETYNHVWCCLHC
jgi:hypothetical protein